MAIQTNNYHLYKSETTDYHKDHINHLNENMDTIDGALKNLDTNKLGVTSGQSIAGGGTQKNVADDVNFNGNVTYHGGELINADDLEAHKQEVEEEINKTKEVMLSSAFTTRVTASDETGSKYEIKDKSIAKIKSLSGRSLKSDNLLNIPDFPETTTNGITYSITNGVIKLNGTATSDINIFIGLTNTIKQGTYYLHNYFSGTTSRNFYINIRSASGTNSDASRQDSENSITTTFDSIYMRIYISNGTIIVNGILKTMISYTSSTAYQPYFEGIKNAPVTSIKSYDDDNNLIGTLEIPSEIQALEGYGWGLSDADKSLNNYIDFKRKKFVQNVGKVDLGTLTYSKASYGFYSWSLKDTIKLPANSTILGNIICPIYKNVIGNNIENGDMNICFREDGALLIRDTSCADIPSLLTKLNGLPLYYQLATPSEPIDISEYLTDDTYLTYNEGTETLLGTEIPTLTEITYNADLDAQVVENADNIAKLREQHDSDMAQVDSDIRSGVNDANSYTDQQISAIPESPIQSVNGKTGEVVLGASDVGATPITVAKDNTQNDVDIMANRYVRAMNKAQTACVPIQASTLKGPNDKTIIPQHACNNDCISDAWYVDTTRCDGVNNDPYLVDMLVTTHMPADCVRGIREVYFLDANRIMVKIFGFDTEAKSAIWIDQYNTVNGVGWEGWKRLADMGFKEGVATANVVNSSSIISNSLIKQGKMVNFNFGGYSINMETIAIPEGFRPKADVVILVSVMNIYEMNVVALVTIHPDGTVTCNGDTKVYSYMSIKNSGWQTA